jgi:hypothetical protein
MKHLHDEKDNCDQQRKADHQATKWPVPVALPGWGIASNGMSAEHNVELPWRQAFHGEPVILGLGCGLHGLSLASIQISNSRGRPGLTGAT